MYCKTVKIGEVEVRMSFANKKEADRMSNEELVKNAKQFEKDIKKTIENQ